MIPLYIIIKFRLLQIPGQGEINRLKKVPQTDISWYFNPKTESLSFNLTKIFSAMQALGEVSLT